MKSRSPRLSRVPLPVGLIAALAFMAAVVAGDGGAVTGGPGATAASAARPAASQQECSAMDRIEGAEALLAAMDLTPTRVVRVLVKARSSPEALADLQRALQAAKVAIDPVGRGPWLVAELHAAQLRALLATCQVLAVQRDQPAPTD
ncbi:hypothetical protein ACQ859_03010 [Roseateles chitinivorans]|uniref:hypothetical protein n=1 Tax=Roseateles chitinivorans TaxID=2917965 RepID=UPI003D6666F8